MIISNQNITESSINNEIEKTIKILINNNYKEKMDFIKKSKTLITNQEFSILKKINSFDKSNDVIFKIPRARTI